MKYQISAETELRLEEKHTAYPRRCDRKKKGHCVLVIVFISHGVRVRDWWTRWAFESVCNKKQRPTVMDGQVSVRLRRAEVLVTSN